MKVMTVVGTRPEIIKLSRVITELDKYTEHILVHTGQNFDFELNEIFFKDLEIRKPDYFLDSAQTQLQTQQQPPEKQSPDLNRPQSSIETIANILVKIDVLFEKIKPDALLVYGDTNSCMVVIPAKKRKIPIFHMEAGNRSFDQRVPEEINRKIVDHLSDINMPITEHARRYLVSEGIRPEQVIKVGSSMWEVLNYNKVKIENSKILSELNLEKNKYFIVSAHREENIENAESFNDLLNTLNQLANHFNLRILVSTHPRTRKKLELTENKMSPLIEFMKPFGFSDYIQLQKNAYCVLSDSGTITEEASLLSIPAVMLRQAHERPEGMDDGVLIMSGLKYCDVLDAIHAVTQMKKPPIVQDYQVENLSENIVKIILSYTHYINRTTWRKY